MASKLAVGQTGAGFFDVFDLHNTGRPRLKLAGHIVPLTLRPLLGVASCTHTPPPTTTIIMHRRRLYLFIDCCRDPGPRPDWTLCIRDLCVSSLSDNDDNNLEVYIHRDPRPTRQSRTHPVFGNGCPGRRAYSQVWDLGSVWKYPSVGIRCLLHTIRHST